MWYFSVVQRLHVFVPLTYGDALSSIDQDRIGLFVPFFFNSPKYFDSSVSHVGFTFVLERVSTFIPSVFKRILLTPDVAQIDYVIGQAFPVYIYNCKSERKQTDVNIKKV